MQHEIVRALLFAAGFLALLGGVELLHKRLKLRGELTRKIAHFAATAATLSFPFLFTVHWYALAMAVLFFLLLFFSRGTRYLTSINDIDRDSAGSFLLPAGLYLPFLISLRMNDAFLFLLPMLILAISDPLAGLIGVSYRSPQIVIRSYNTRKTVYGSSAFFASSLLISVLAVSLDAGSFSLNTTAVALCVAASATLTELLSPWGTDNLAVPLVALAVLSLFRHGVN